MNSCKLNLESFDFLKAKSICQMKRQTEIFVFLDANLKENSCILYYEKYPFCLFL